MFFLDKQGRLRPIFQIILGFILFIFCSIPSAFAIDNKIAMLLMPIIQVAFILGGFYLYFKWLYKDQLPPTLDCFHFNKRSILLLVGGMGIGIIAFCLSVIPLYLTNQYRLSFNQLDIFSLIYSFLFFATVGYGEELLTRGVMQHAFLKYGKWPALFLTSFLFSAIHLSNNGVTAGALLGVFAAGLILGMSMYATNSISMAIGFHITWNWVQGSIYGINVSGTELVSGLFKTKIIGKNDLLTGGAFGAEASYVTISVLFLGCLIFYYYGKKQQSKVI